jgi:NodT family efflux transporter outer membrane factor (OMF) lipoprotein
MTSTLPRAGAVVVGLIAATALAGCMVGPDFTRPEALKDQGYLPEALIAETASADVLGGEAQRYVQDLDIPGQWWTVFRSKPLDDLIEQAIKANPDLQTAIAALKVAQQNARAQRAALFPTVGLSGSATHNEVPATTASPLVSGNSIFGLFTAFLNISYVFDVFGGVRRAAESLDAQAEAQCFLLEAAYLTLASNVVVAVVTEASLRGQVAATQRTVDIQRQTLALLQRRRAIGQAALADVATQQAALAQSEAALPPLRRQLDQQRHLLSNLAGQTTNHAPAAIFELSALQLPLELPVTVPSRLVEQRPDIRAAEANIHSASAAVGVAVAAQLPQFSLGINYGAQVPATDQFFRQLFVPGFAADTVGVSFLQTLLDGGALLARKRAAQAAWEQAKSQYRSTVLTAFRNVADSLRALEFDAMALAATASAERAAALSLTITQRRLAAGDAGILDVLNAELTYQTAVLALVQAQANRFADTAALYQALGGGWWNRDADGNTNPAKRATCKPPVAPAKP